MKKKSSVVFKILLNILIFGMFLRVLDISLLFFEKSADAIALLPTESWKLFDWLMLTSTLIGYLIFIIGIIKLRNISGSLIDNKPFTDSLIKSLSQAGDMFIFSGIIIFTVDVVMSLDSYINNSEPVFIFAIFDPFLQIIIGLFFKIQGNTISEAKIYKDEYDLTI